MWSSSKLPVIKMKAINTNYDAGSFQLMIWLLPILCQRIRQKEIQKGDNVSEYMNKHYERNEHVCVCVEEISVLTGAHL